MAENKGRGRANKRKGSQAKSGEEKKRNGGFYNGVRRDPWVLPLKHRKGKGSVKKNNFQSGIL